MSAVLSDRKISRLQFNKVKLEDAGEYSCEAENVLGKDTAKGSLNVKSGKWRSQRMSRAVCHFHTKVLHMVCLGFCSVLLGISSKTILGDKKNAA